jgi:hypothetical protein
MTTNNISEAAKAVIRRNTEEVQGGGNFELFEQLFADDFSTTRRSRAARRTRPVPVNCTKSCAPRFPTFTPTSIGSSPMEIA